MYKAERRRSIAREFLEKTKVVNNRNLLVTSIDAGAFELFKIKPHVNLFNIWIGLIFKIWSIFLGNLILVTLKKDF